MKLKVDKEMKISFEEFYKEWLLKNNILSGRIMIHLHYVLQWVNL